MAVYSMTGFASVGAGTGAAGTPAVDSTSENTRPSMPAMTVEIRSINSRFLDISFRMADELRPLEPALRELLTQGLRRGKVELRIATAREADAGWPQPRPDQLSRLSRLEAAVLGWLPKAQPLSVNEVLQWCRQAPAPEARSDTLALETAARALEELKAARAREGARLADMLRERVASLRRLAATAAPLVGQVVQRQRERFIERWNEALAAAGGDSLPADTLRERALGEAAAYALRIDVAEELTRLQSHLDEIERLLAAGGELGKRLDFLIQELQREANTLGSKSTAMELSAIAVDMKVLIEQMREQVQNIE